jgi:hypothetical protein
VPFKPYVVSPLSVAQNREKKRLILDLSILNTYVIKQKVKFEDHKVALQYFQKDFYCIKFDLKSGYHHIDISKESQTFLGFEWNGKYFCFTVLPFGLSSAPYIFTKCLRTMVKYWRYNNIKIVLYLDDGLAMADSVDECYRISRFIRISLQEAGFLINFEKSVFSPVKELEWLGITWNSTKFSISIPERRIRDFENNAVQFISELPKVSARSLARVAGKIMSMHAVMGNLCKLMTKYCYMEIALRQSWGSRLNLKFSDSSIKELQFWLQNIRKYNDRKLKSTERETTLVYSDASCTGAGAYTVGLDETFFHQMWSPDERKRSSTWREMKAIELALLSFKKKLINKSVKWFTDNQSCVHILQSGSMKPDLQEIAYDIFLFCRKHNTSINIQWVPRDKNQKADYLSKIIDFEDWGVTKTFFDFIDSLYGPHTVDRFASAKNNKLPRFNSLYWNPGTEAVDSFTQNWAMENNWLVPPIYLVIRTIRFIIFNRAVGTLVVPKWISATFWPYIYKDRNSTQEYVADILEFDDVSGIFEQGQNTNTIFGSNRFYSPVLVVRLDARFL